MSDNNYNVKERLLSFKKKFDSSLTSFFDQKISQFKKIDPQIVSLVEQVKDLTLRGGKRLRPAFLYYGFRACGGKDKEKVLPSCLASEVAHSMALIHDDIMDNSDLRRGGPTVHKVLGVQAAILAGDLCFSWAEELYGRGPRRYWDLLKEEVILGQYLDTSLASKERLNDDFEDLERKVLKVLEYKTARYSVVRPLQIGAALAGGKEKELKTLENYGLPLGIAFQITDDILGMFGDEKTVAKPVGSDLKEGKITLLIVKTIGKLKAPAKGEARQRRQSSKLKAKTQSVKLKKFLSLVGNKRLTKKDLEWVRGIINETGALKYCQNKAQELVKQAKTAIKDYPFEKKAKEFLLGIADFVVKRKY